MGQHGRPHHTHTHTHTHHTTPHHTTPHHHYHHHHHTIRAPARTSTLDTTDNSTRLVSSGMNIKQSALWRHAATKLPALRCFGLSQGRGAYPAVIVTTSPNASLFIPGAKVLPVLPAREVLRGHKTMQIIQPDVRYRDCNTMEILYQFC